MLNKWCDDSDDDPIKKDQPGGKGTWLILEQSKSGVALPLLWWARVFWSQVGT